MGSESIQTALFMIMFKCDTNSVQINLIIFWKIIKTYIQGYTSCAFLYHGQRMEFTTDINLYESAPKWLFLKFKNIFFQSIIVFLPVEHKSEEWHDFSTRQVQSRNI